MHQAPRPCPPARESLRELGLFALFLSCLTELPEVLPEEFSEKVVMLS